MKVSYIKISQRAMCCLTYAYRCIGMEIEFQNGRLGAALQLGKRPVVILGGMGIEEYRSVCHIVKTANVLIVRDYK